MKSKTVKMVSSVAVLAVLCGAYFRVKTYVAKQEQEENNAEEDETVNVISLTEDDIQSIEFLVEKNEVTFEKEDDSWVKSDETDFPVNQDKLDEAISTMSIIDADRVLEDVENLDEYGLSTPENTIVFTDGDGTETSLRVGSLNESTSQYYVGKDDDKETVYVVDETSLSSVMDVENLYDFAQGGEFPTIDSSSIYKVEVEGDKSYVLEEDEDSGLWNISGSSSDNTDAADVTNATADAETDSTTDTTTDTATDTETDITTDGTTGTETDSATGTVASIATDTTTDAATDTATDTETDITTDTETDSTTGAATDTTTDTTTGTATDTTTSTVTDAAASTAADTITNTTEEADSAKVSTLTSSISGLAYENFINYNCTDKSEYGLDDPYAKIIVDYEVEVEAEDTEEAATEDTDSSEADTEETATEGTDSSETDIEDVSTADDLETEEVEETDDITDTEDTDASDTENDSETEEVEEEPVIEQKQLIVYVGNEVEGSDSRYVCVDDSMEIYTISNESLSAIIDKENIDFWSMTVNYLSVNQLDELEIDYNDVKHTVNVSRETSEDEDGEETETTTYLMDDEEIDSTSFTTFYNKLINISGQKRLTESYEPDSKPEMETVFKDVDGNETTVDFYSYDTNFYAVVVDQKVYLVNKMTVKELFTAYEELAGGDTDTSEIVENMEEDTDSTEEVENTADSTDMTENAEDEDTADITGTTESLEEDEETDSTVITESPKEDTADNTESAEE